MRKYGILATARAVGISVFLAGALLVGIALPAGVQGAPIADVPTVKAQPKIDHKFPIFHGPFDTLAQPQAPLQPRGAMRPSLQIFKADGSGLEALDLQVAVSSSHVMATSSHAVSVWSKAGALLRSWSTAEFFAPAMANANQTLKDPTNGGSLTPAVGEAYDTRLLYDAFRKRFWMHSLGRNISYTSPDEAHHRVNPEFIAVSKTENPLDGWHLYWFEPGGHGAGDPFFVGPAKQYMGPAGRIRDYANIGISRDLFVIGYSASTGAWDPSQVDPADGKNPVEWTWPDMVQVMPANDLANGQLPKTAYLMGDPDLGADYKTADSEMVVPVTHSDLSALEVQYLVSVRTSNTTRLVVWAINPDYPDAVWKAEVPLERGACGELIASQKSHPEVPNPPRLSAGNNVGFIPQRAVFRQGKLYVIFHDSKQWSADSGCLPSLHLVRMVPQISLALLLGVGTPQSIRLEVDRIFGWRGQQDPPGAAFAYYWPTVDVNNDGTAVACYARSGTTIYPEVRCSLYRKTDTDIRPSFLVHAGEYPKLGGDKAAGRMDFVGSAVDPSDNTTVWFIHAYPIRIGVGDHSAFQVFLGRLRP